MRSWIAFGSSVVGRHNRPATVTGRPGSSIAAVFVALQVFSDAAPAARGHNAAPTSKTAGTNRRHTSLRAFLFSPETGSKYTLPRARHGNQVFHL